MSSHYIPFEDEIRQTCLDHKTYRIMDIWGYGNNFLGTQKGDQNGHGRIQNVLRGTNFDNIYFFFIFIFLMREERIQIPSSGSSSAHQQNTI